MFQIAEVNPPNFDASCGYELSNKKLDLARLCLGEKTLLTKEIVGLRLPRCLKGVSRGCLLCTVPNAQGVWYIIYQHLGSLGDKGR